MKLTSPTPEEVNRALELLQLVAVFGNPLTQLNVRYEAQGGLSSSMRVMSAVHYTRLFA